VLGVVGWTDLDAADADEVIARRAQHPKFVGVRPMLQDIADPRWILDPRRSRALDAIQSSELAFDALIRPGHLDVIAQLASRYPRLNIVIDHAAKPAIGSHRDLSWQSGMRRLSTFDNVFCKLSGLMTERTPGTDAALVEEHVLALLAMFRSSRVIWGSDWPVLTTAASYQEWLALCQRCLANFDSTAQRGIMGGNAAQTYRLGRDP
jgi:L-fuconolactonase